MSEVNWRIGRMENLGSPWGNAGGVVKSVEEFEKMALTGVGWIEPGSYTLEERFGNQKTQPINQNIEPITGEPIVYFHDPLTAETTNSLGMPNPGRDKLLTMVPEMLRIAEVYEKEAVFNIAPVTDDPVAEVYELVHSLASVGVRRIVVNLGCPNVLGPDGKAHGTLSHHPSVVGRALRGLRPLIEKYPDLDIYVRTSPDEDTKRLSETRQEIIGSRVVRVDFVHNTWPLTPEQLANTPLGVAGGGRSGSSGELIEAADRQLKQAVRQYKGTGIDVVMSTGIRNSERLKQVMKLGAVAGAGTTFYYEAQESWEEATDKLIMPLLPKN
jgi:dihydroorotate dehydrogenase